VHSENAEDPYLALGVYQATPLPCGYSPTELLMGRALRTTAPVSQEMLKPAVLGLAILRRREQRAKANFDRRHKAYSVMLLNQGDRLWLPKEQLSAAVQANA